MFVVILLLVTLHYITINGKRLV